MACCYRFPQPARTKTEGRLGWRPRDSTTLYHTENATITLHNARSRRIFCAIRAVNADLLLVGDDNFYLDIYTSGDRRIASEKDTCAAHDGRCHMKGVWRLQIVCSAKKRGFFDYWGANVDQLDAPC